MYTFDVTTSAATAKEEAKRTTLTVGKGVLRKWRIHYPVGSSGLLYLQFKYGESNLIPTTQDGYFVGDNIGIEGEDFLYLKNPPYEIQVITWNLDPGFAHRVTGSFDIHSLWTLSPVSERFLQLIEDDDREEVARIF